jgi:hypothetical protein
MVHSYQERRKHFGALVRKLTKVARLATTDKAAGLLCARLAGVPIGCVVAAGMQQQPLLMSVSERSRPPAGTPRAPRSEDSM